MLHEISLRFSCDVYVCMSSRWVFVRLKLSLEYRMLVRRSTASYLSIKNWDIWNHFGSLRREVNDCSQRETVNSGSLVEIRRIRIGSQLSTSIPKVFRVGNESLTEDWILLIEWLFSSVTAGISKSTLILLSTNTRLFSNRVFNAFQAKSKLSWDISQNIRFISEKVQFRNGRKLRVIYVHCREHITKRRPLFVTT